MEKETGYVWHYTVGTPLAAIARSGVSCRLPH
jgi:hypothetical protein